MSRLLSVWFAAALCGAGLVGFGAAAQSTPKPDLLGRKYGETRAYFKDWLAACRPDGYCSALAYVGADGDLFERSLRVAAPVPGSDYALILVGPIGVPPGVTMTLRIDDGSPIGLEGGADLGWANEPGDSANEFRVSQTAANLKAIPQMKAGRWLVASWPVPGGPPQTARFSLRGLTAALAWIAAEQRR